MIDSSTGVGSQDSSVGCAHVRTLYNRGHSPRYKRGKQQITQQEKT